MTTKIRLTKSEIAEVKRYVTKKISDARTYDKKHGLPPQATNYSRLKRDLIRKGQQMVLRKRKRKTTTRKTTTMKKVRCPPKKERKEIFQGAFLMNNHVKTEMTNSLKGSDNERARGVRKKKTWALSSLLALIFCIAIVSGYSVNFGNSDATFSRHDFIDRVDVADTDRSFSVSFVGFNIRFITSDDYWYGTLLDSAGGYIFRGETPNPLAFQNVTNRDGTAVTDLKFLNDGRSILWRKRSGDDFRYNVFMKNYVARSSTNSSNVAPDHDHSHPSGMKVCKYRGGNYKITWSPVSKPVQNVSYAKIPAGRTFRNNYLRDASTSNSVSNFNLTNRSFELNVGSFRGDVLFMQFRYTDNTLSDVSNRTITSVDDCEPMITPPTNQTTIITSSDVGKSIVFSVVFIVLSGFWLLFARITWITKFSEKNQIRAGKFFITKGKYVKITMIMLLYAMTMTLMNVMTSELPKFLDVPLILSNVKFFSDILLAVFIPFYVAGFIVLIWMFIADLWEKGNWFKFEKF